MKKIFFIVLSLLVVTLVMLFYIKFDEGVVIKSKENTIIIPQEENMVSGSYLEISFLDVGQGDSAFIEWESGKQMIVDCGKDSKVLSELGRVMSFYDKHIDYMLVTHPDLDHFGGCIDVLKRFNIGTIIYNGVMGDSKAWNYFWDLVESEGVKYKKIDSFEIWDIDNTQIKFLYPELGIPNKTNNDGSIIFVMSYGESDILFAGDAEKGLEKYLLENYENYLDAEILKVSHHGSGGSSNKDFLDKVSPEYSVISVGENNSYGHPSTRVLKRLERLGTEIFRTDLSGKVVFKVYDNNIERVFE